MEASAAAPRSAASAPKPERKKFSLGNLMRPVSREQVPREITIANNTKNVDVPVELVLVPSWVTGPAVLDAPLAQPRLLALEFLLEMAGHFPEGTVNVESVALSVERAVFDWAQKQPAPGSGDAWTRKYWAKIHALVAAICGKQKEGTVQRLILQGRFDLPEKLVLLSDDMLAASFEGRPVSV